MTDLAPWAIAAFAALTCATVALWFGWTVRHDGDVWMGCLAASAVAAMLGGVVHPAGLLALAVLAAACAASRGGASGWRLVAHAVMLAVAAALMLHAVPGFDNPRVLDRVRLSADAVPYTKYLNFDKAAAGLLLIGVYAPGQVTGGEGRRHLAAFAWRWLVVVAVVIGLTVGAGYARWDPKWPSWWLPWVWSMVCLTALPEEVLFRGLLQPWAARGLGAAAGAWLPVLVAGVAFGLAHAAGGVVYVLLATVAGIGYGWIRARTRSLGLAVLAHAGLNTVHLFAFSYPALSAMMG